jgi:hypothetical protein
VTIAVALVAGQVALCSVIGWITFGDLVDPAASGQRAVGSAPSFGADVPAAPEPTATPLGTAAPSATTAVDSTPPPKVRPARSTSVAAKRPAARPSTSTGTPGPTTTADAVLLPAPADSEAVQEPVRRWSICSPEEALGRTEDGDRLRCRRSDDGELRWHTA